MEAVCCGTFYRFFVGGCYTFACLAENLPETLEKVNRTLQNPCKVIKKP